MNFANEIFKADGEAPGGRSPVDVYRVRSGWLKRNGWRLINGRRRECQCQRILDEGQDDVVN